MFELKRSIEGWKQKLGANQSFTSQDIEELESHLLDEIDLLKKKELSEEEAFFIACSRLGSVELLGSEFSKVNTKSIYQKKAIWLLGGFIFIAFMTRIIALLSLLLVVLLNKVLFINTNAAGYLNLSANLLLSALFLFFFLTPGYQFLNRLQSLFIRLFTARKALFILLFAGLVILYTAGAYLLAQISIRSVSITFFGNAMIGEQIYSMAWSVILCIAFIVITIRKSKSESA